MLIHQRPTYKNPKGYSVRLDKSSISTRGSLVVRERLLVAPLLLKTLAKSTYICPVSEIEGGPPLGVFLQSGVELDELRDRCEIKLNKLSTRSTKLHARVVLQLWGMQESRVMIKSVGFRK